MNTPGLGLHEERTRVICHLPVGHPMEEKAMMKVLSYVDGLRRTKTDVKGYTKSSIRPIAFRGCWRGEDGIVEEDVVIVIIDYRLAFSDSRTPQFVKTLHEKVCNEYERAGRPQEVVWVVAQQVLRYD